MRRFRVLGLVIVSVALAGTQGAVRADETRSFKARLSPVPIEIATAPNIAGGGTATAELKGRTLVVSGSFEGLRSPATVARLHYGPKGVRGPAKFDLTVTRATSGKISASLELTPAQVEELAQGRFYIQLHSEKAPDGNLWGWLLLQESRR